MSVKVAADVEGVDKLLTFLCVGFLGSLSDVVGRKPLMMYSSLGFGLTCLLQASTTNRLSTLYLADIVDGVSSCMSGVCQAYVADASDPASRAINLGIFQGISIAGAFIVGIPISAILSQKVGLRAPVYLAAAVQVLNFGLIALVTPESNPASARKGRRLNLREANEPLSPICRTPFLAYPTDLILFLSLSLGEPARGAQTVIWPCAAAPWRRVHLLLHLARQLLPQLALQ